MEIRYSVIIPTFNRVEQLRLTLVSLDRVHCPKDQFEIIVVDDGSTDGTWELVDHFQTAIPLLYLCNEVKRGRSVTRNLGLKHARGTFVVFCDADFVVVPELFQLLDEGHRTHPRSVLSGAPYSLGGAYTHIHADFSAEEKMECRNILTQVNLWKDEYDTVDHIVPLLTPDDLVHQTDTLSKLLIPDRMIPGVREQFAKTDVAPWVKLITRFISVKRSYLTKIGGFNENFIKYGLEDWDLGYKLHRMKVRFHSVESVLGYHQEHPNLMRGEIGNDDNLRIMFQAHGFEDPELNLFAVIPAWEDLQTYKYTLRLIRRGLRSKSERKAALLMRNTLRLAAKQWTHGKNNPAFKRSLRAIRLQSRLLKRKKSETAQMLQVLLDKSAKLTEG